MILRPIHRFALGEDKRARNDESVNEKDTTMRTFQYGTLGFFLSCGLLLAPDPAGGGKEKGWIPLYNGIDLSGWDTWLGQPFGEKESIGLNKDPRKVYTLVEEDGK